MGASKRRREMFLAQHPVCCFCGGQEPATTIDHVPLRAAFVGNVGPEGFEFPACEACNSGTSDTEQVFALYARIFDRNDDNYDRPHIAKLIQGVRNNYPDMIPEVNLRANEKRRILRQWGWGRPGNDFLENVGLAALPKTAARHMEANTAKLLAALYYRHQQLALTREEGVFVGWSQQGLPGVDEAQATLFEGLPELVIGERVNTDIGDQFAYRWGINPSQQLFGFAAGFGAGLFLMAAAVPWERVAGQDNWTRYEPPRSPPKMN